MNENALRHPFEKPGPSLSQAHANILAAPMALLEERSSDLIDRWTELYLGALGRESLFSPERVRKIFKEMWVLFFHALRSSDFGSYFEALEERGRMFSRVGVPFEEAILSLQLFQEAYLSLILENEPTRDGLKEILPAFEEFNHLSTSVLAASFFKEVKDEWETASEAYREENSRIRSELRTLHEDLFHSAHRRLDAMNLAMKSINKKLRRSVFYARQIQRLSEILAHEPRPEVTLLIASKHLKKVLPPDAELVFGLFDEHRERLTLRLRSAYAENTAEPLELVGEIYRSELVSDLQDALFSDVSAPVLKDKAFLPDVLKGDLRLASQTEFLFLALKVFREPLGFILIGAPQTGTFSRSSAKLYQRLSTVIANATFSAVHFSRSRRERASLSLLDQLDRPMPHRKTLEATLDFSLSSLIDLLGIERVSLMLLDEKSKTLSTFAAKGYRVYPFSGLRLRWGEGLAGSCLEHSKSISISRLDDPAHVELFERKPRGEGGQSSARHSIASRGVPREGYRGQTTLALKSLACVPLMCGGDPLGVLNLSTISFHKKFEPSELESAREFGQRISRALMSSKEPLLEAPSLA